MNWIMFLQNLGFLTMHLEVRVCGLWLNGRLMPNSVWELVPEALHWNSQCSLRGRQDNTKQLVVSDLFMVSCWFLLSGNWCIPCPVSFPAISSVLLFFFFKWKTHKKELLNYCKYIHILICLNLSHYFHGLQFSHISTKWAVIAVCREQSGNLAIGGFERYFRIIFFLICMTWDLRFLI